MLFGLVSPAGVAGLRELTTFFFGKEVHAWSYPARKPDKRFASAADEAGRIGGPGGAEGVDEEDRPLAESGEGEAEGFEQAEEELIEHASHGDPAPDPTAMAGETEAEEAPAEYGEPDEERVSELDPDERTD